MDKRKDFRKLIKKKHGIYMGVFSDPKDLTPQILTGYLIEYLEEKG